MRKKPGMLFILAAMTITTVISCKNDDDKIDDCSIFWATELQDELTDISTTATAYFNDPSVANCSAYRSAYEAYINALEPYGDCTALTGQNRSQWELALTDARESLTTLCD